MSELKNESLEAHAENKARWWFARHHKICALGDEISYQRMTDAEVSLKYSAMRLELEESYPHFGTIDRPGGNP
jgi:hypothetical protein